MVATAAVDTSRWYVECGVVVARRAFRRHSGRATAHLASIGAAAKQVPVGERLRVYYDGSSYIETVDGRSQMDIALYGALWDADDTAAWARFKALVREAEGMGKS